MEIRTSHSKMQSTTAEDTPTSEVKQPQSTAPAHSGKNDNDRYMDRSDDLAAQVRAAREAAQRRMDAFGEVSEYEVRVVRGRMSEVHPSAATDEGTRRDEPQS